MTDFVEVELVVKSGPDWLTIDRTVCPCSAGEGAEGPSLFEIVIDYTAINVFGSLGSVLIKEDDLVELRITGRDDLVKVACVQIIKYVT
jgi:hypothetical protein